MLQLPFELVSDLMRSGQKNKCTTIKCYWPELVPFFTTVPRFSRLARSKARVLRSPRSGRDAPLAVAILWLISGNLLAYGNLLAGLSRVSSCDVIVAGDEMAR